MRFFTNFKISYLALILAFGFGIYFLLNNLLLFSANLFLLAVFIFIYVYLKRYSLNLKAHIGFLPAFFILSLFIYHYLIKYNLALPALALALSCSFFIYKIKKSSTFNLLFEKTVICAIVLVFIAPNIVLVNFHNREKILEKENHLIVSELYNEIEKSKEEISLLTSDLAANAAIPTLLKEKKYAELLSYLQNIKTADNIDYILIKDHLDNIIINTQHETSIGGDFSNEYPKAINQSFSDIKIFDGKILVCSERKVELGAEDNGQIITGRYPRMENMLSILKNSHPSLLALMITSDGKSTAFASNSMILESLTQSDLAKQVPFDKIITSFLNGEKLTFFKSNLLNDNNEALSSIIISRNDMSRESKNNLIYIFSIFLFLLFSGIGFFHMQSYFKNNLPVNIRKIIAGKTVNIKRLMLFFRRFSGYCGVMSIGIFVGFVFFIILLIKNFDFISSNSGTPVKTTRSLSFENQVVNQLPTIIPEEIYITKGDETTLSLYSSTTPLADFDIDINIDQNYFDISAINSTSYNCKSFLNATTKISCTIKNESPKDRTIATVVLKTKKEGFANITLDKITIYGNNNEFQELTLNDKIVLLIK